VNLEYQDTVTLLQTAVDGYGNESVVAEADVAATVDFNTAWRHGASQDAINSNAVVFVDPDDDFVQVQLGRLEGMLVVVPLFGASDDQSWFRVISSIVSRDTQLDNEIDNIQLLLKKSSRLQSVS
jgi:hypothetical protein